MKRTIIYLITIFLCVHSVLSQDKKAYNNIDTSKVSSELAEIIANNSDLFPNNTQLSIALIDGETTNYIGVIRKNDSLQTIINKEAIFEVGSNTKVFTSLLFSKQVHAGNLQLNDKLVDVLPFTLDKSPEKTKEISLQMLANHSSGLPTLPQNIFPLLEKNMENPYQEYTVAMLQEYLKSQIVLENNPNKVSSYSNLGAGLLGYILTEKTNKTYENLLQKHILQPLQMNQTSTSLSNIDCTKLVIGLQADGTKTDNWDFTDALVGAGGIKSNVVDMEKFIRKNLEDDTLYNLPQQPTIKINETVQVGLGWHIISKNNKTFLFHNGGTGGYSSCMIIDKKNKKAALLLSNVSTFSPQGPKIDNLCFTLMKTL